MLNQITDYPLLNRIKGTALGKRLKNSRLARLYVRSAGDWRYPFMIISWWVVKQLQPRKTISTDGVSFTLSCTNWITHFRWYLFKIKDQEVRYFINKYVKEDDVFFDIGANVGVFSIYAAKKKPKAAVYSFEPEYSNLYVLKDNIYHNGLNDRVKIYGIGISDFNGLSELHLQDIAAGAAAHTENKERISKTDEGYPIVWSEGIHAVTLDNVCDQLGVVPNTIKIDTDGNELHILKGAENILLDKKLRSMILEMPDNKEKENACYSILKASGFKSVAYPFNKTKNQIWVKS